ncbi:NADH:flavin oxidoreductase/NADH oxidase [Aspergillus lucknowensis]|uniref:NADH:flavin oxidoreductase/NADH oxidase N-terminal domain-containing protein n=1 Tax=Aspergillus lucknowensis TaxID=176173 RepID=A0ABR4LVZ0_9EURO
MASTDLKTAPSPAVLPAQGIPYFTPAANPGAAANPIAKDTPTLFRPLQIRDVTLKNRVIVSPMCMYSTVSDPSSPFIGALTDFHLAHLGHLALKGAGLVIIEATAVQPNGRISPNDSGLWQWQEGTESEQFKGLKRVVDFVHAQGGKIGIQLAHAGRKASTVAPWLAMEKVKADESVFGWPEDVVGPSGGEENIWAEGGVSYWAPRELSTEEVEEIVRAFARSAELAVKAGVDIIEIHGAHGYLVNEFLSPVTNRRTDKYGGSFENRTRFLREIALAIRDVVPEGLPLFLRISATEWLEEHPIAAERGTWDINSSVELLKYLPEIGVDFLDVSSGGNHKDQKIPTFTDCQINLAGQLRKEIRAAGAKTLVGAVGLITQADAASEIVQGADEDEAHRAESMLAGSEPKADAVLMARQFLREADWVVNAAKKLGVQISPPLQFGRAYL